MLFVKVITLFFCVLSQNILAANFPKPSAEVLQRCLEAVYAEEVGKYVREHISHLVTHKKSANVHDWKFAIFQDNASKEFIIAFAGARNIHNKNQVLYISDKIFTEMNSIISKWAIQYGTPSIFTGHSQGGVFAEKCKTSWDVWRITWNGRQSEHNFAKKLIAFGTAKDWLKWVPNNSRIQLKTKKKGHGIYCFRDVAKNDWHRLFGINCPNSAVSSAGTNSPELKEETPHSISLGETMSPSLEPGSSFSMLKQYLEAFQNQCAWAFEGTSEPLKIELQDAGQLLLKKNMPQIYEFCQGIMKCEATLDMEKLWKMGSRVLANCALIVLNQVEHNIFLHDPGAYILCKMPQAINYAYSWRDEAAKKTWCERLRLICNIVAINIGSKLAQGIMPLRKNYSWWIMERAFFQISEMSIYKAIPLAFGIASEWLQNQVHHAKFLPSETPEEIEKLRRRALLESLGFQSIKSTNPLIANDELWKDPDGLIWGNRIFANSATKRNSRGMDSHAIEWSCQDANGRLPSKKEFERLAGFLGKKGDCEFRADIFPGFRSRDPHASKKFLTSTVVESGPLEGLHYVFNSETGNSELGFRSSDHTDSAPAVLYVYLERKT